MIGYGTKKKRTPNTWVGSYQKLPYSWFIKMAYQRGLRINHVLNGMILQEKQMFSGIWKARVATRNEWRNRLTKKTYEQMRHEKGVRRGLFRAISGEGTSDCYDCLLYNYSSNYFARCMLRWIYPTSKVYGIFPYTSQIPLQETTTMETYNLVFQNHPALPSVILPYFGFSQCTLPVRHIPNHAPQQEVAS